MKETYRNIIVSNEFVELARKITETLAPVGGKGMYTTPLSSTGEESATHWISSGYIDEDYANLLPLVEWKYEISEGSEEGNWTKTFVSNGYPEIILDMYTQAIQIPEEEPIVSDVTLEEITDMLNSSDITLETPQQSWARLGIQLIQSKESVE